MKWHLATSSGLALALAGCDQPAPAVVPEHGQFSADECEVVVAGGSTAALAAALHSAREGVRTCLLEPTGWPGGQLTAGGVSAIDFAWHFTAETWGQGVNVGRWSRLPANNARTLADWVAGLAVGVPSSSGNPGACWVSIRCFLPLQLLERYVFPAIAAEANLTVFHDTVVRRVSRQGRQLIGLTAVQRRPVGAARRQFLSEEIDDWYSPHDSAYYHKRVLSFGYAGRPPVFIDASEFGDVLALAEVDYLQGAEASEETPAVIDDDTCGQATVFPAAIEYAHQPDPVPAATERMARELRNVRISYPEHYSVTAGDRGFSWEDVWSYRRIHTEEPGRPTPPNFKAPPAAPGDVSMQNWGSGNDFPYGYLLLPRARAAATRHDWRGGIDTHVLREAERLALGWFLYYRRAAPPEIAGHLRLSTGEGDAPGVLGSRNGLSLMPYLRDTRRSIGLDGYVLHYRRELFTGARPHDAVAIGAYDADVHELTTCELPPHIAERNRPVAGQIRPLPFYLPFRAHTHRDVDNLLVAGKTMAQTFLANSATRLHPIEFHSGVAAGVAAAFMARESLTSRAALAAIEQVQERIRRYAPLVWTDPDAPVPAPAPVEQGAPAAPSSEQSAQ
jgi:hypothetical protein